MEPGLLFSTFKSFRQEVERKSRRIMDEQWKQLLQFVAYEAIRPVLHYHYGLGDVAMEIAQFSGFVEMSIEDEVFDHSVLPVLIFTSSFLGDYLHQMQSVLPKKMSQHDRLNALFSSPGPAVHKNDEGRCWRFWCKHFKRCCCGRPVLQGSGFNVGINAYHYNNDMFVGGTGFTGPVGF